ncbi:MAG TPA: hypothetical protein VGH87_13725 [Polyangiaceae bacterium]|jgi:hypothetical protein
MNPLHWRTTNAKETFTFSEREQIRMLCGLLKVPGAMRFLGTTRETIDGAIIYQRRFKPRTLARLREALARAQVCASHGACA